MSNGEHIAVLERGAAVIAMSHLGRPSGDAAKDAPLQMDRVAARFAELLDAENKAMALLDRIEVLGLIAAGRTEREIEDDIFALAQAEFGVAQHWHDHIVRAGANTLMIVIGSR